MIILLAILLWLVMVLLGAELATKLVYGGNLSDEQIEEYFKDRFDNLKLNYYDDDIMSIEGAGPYDYVSRLPLTPSSKWQIRRLGTIPRLSVWSKMLDKKQTELIIKK